MHPRFIFRENYESKKTECDAGYTDRVRIYHPLSLSRGGDLES